jgi:Reprolysin family propeptide
LSVDTEHLESKKKLAYFIPQKLPGGIPLHEHDVLYGQDELWRRAGKPQQQLPKAFAKKPPFGHFIHKDDELWDSFPQVSQYFKKGAWLTLFFAGNAIQVQFVSDFQTGFFGDFQYEFDAFGRHFHLLLKHDPAASSATQTLRAHHVFSNHSHVQPVYQDASRCFYSGTVRGDNKSKVNLNLCHGMVSTKPSAYFEFGRVFKPLDASIQPLSASSAMFALLFSWPKRVVIYPVHSSVYESQLQFARAMSHSNQLDWAVKAEN